MTFLSGILSIDIKEFAIERCFHYVPVLKCYIYGLYDLAIVHRKIKIQTLDSNLYHDISISEKSLE